ncbi:MAG: cobalamin-binding protein [Gammaproteobacteria bacterium]|nr:cobalamin-binding protein [Gammaproteobacteria bacterium]MCP5139609.1 cobalamin-binding protein [Chromatiales bacterium]
MTGLSSEARCRLMSIVLLVGACLLAGCDADRVRGHAGSPEGPAVRIVTLSPHLAELVYAAGAGRQLVGAVEYSDYPAAARQVPRVGDAFRVDLEAIAALRPDLILGWPSGNSQAVLDRLRRLGYRVVDLEPHTLDDIGRHIRLIGAAAGSAEIADRAAGDWDDGLAALRGRYGKLAPVRVFYQIAPQPLVTATGSHFIGEAIRLCGGTNVFEKLAALTPVISQEAVIAAAPEVIVAADFEPGPASAADASPLQMWRSWPGLPANSLDGLFVIDPDLLNVPGPRMVRGIAELCADIDAVRRKKGARTSLPPAQH